MQQLRHEGAGGRAVVPALLFVGMALWCTALFVLGRHVAFRPIFAYSERSPAQLEDVLSTHDQLAQTAALTPLLLAMTPSQAEGAAAIFEASFAAGGGGGLPLELFVERWTALDPLLARDRVLTWPPERRSEALPTLLRAWARSDPRTAVEVLNEIPAPQLRSAAFPALIEGWADSGRTEGVWRYLAGLESPMDRERGSQVVVYHLVTRGGPDDAIREIEQLPDEPPLGAFKERVLRTAVGLIARSDPARAIELVDAEPDELQRDALVRRVAVNWVTQDGPAAMAWVRSQPPRSQRDRVLREVYRRWVVRDRPAALAWMDEQDDPGDLDPILDIYATALARRDPRSAIAWVRGIESAALRREALMDVAEVWQHQEPEVANAWLRKVGLHDDLQRRIDQRQRRKRGTRDDAQPNAG